MSRRRVAVIAAVSGSALIGLVVVFQLAVALGAPLGRLTQGGGVDGTLPMSGRLVAVGSAVLLTVMGLGLLARADLGPFRAAPRRLVTAVAWFTAVYAGLGMLLNLASPSPAERWTWTPVTALILVCAVVTLRATRRG
jgi:cytochrome bd-type quinol oxidase subunit 2